MPRRGEGRAARSVYVTGAEMFRFDVFNITAPVLRLAG